MKILLPVILLLLIGPGLLAQQDQKAKEILDQVSEKTQSYQTITAGFSFSMENKTENIKEINSGSIKLKGRKYHVELPDLGLKIYSDGKTVWNYMETGNQVSITNIDDNSHELLDLSTIFRIYEQGFRFKFIEEKNASGKILYIIDLIPEQTNKDFSKVTLAINKATLMIHSALMYGYDGNLYGIEISEIKTNLPISDSEFIFDPAKYNDIEIIDFR